MDRNQIPIPGPTFEQSVRPYPQYGPFASIENRGNSTYEAFPIKAEKPTSPGFYFLTDGLPFSPAMGYDPTNTGSQGRLRSLSHPSPSLWFNTNDFPVPTCYCFGDAGKNILEGPGEKGADLAARKYFALTERFNLEFRAEFFNAFNHPVFTQPDNYITDGPGAAGVITSTVIPRRQIQFALKLQF